ncbi:PEP/pyruvate-binding domain-containing protein, partial [Kocuria sp. M4R2S49]|uniref:PEP/pyruvate-binding domain-containing protein n=1 Tax=Kocuria rhizosphaericola TaxID=3376284 RepID=UPI0037AE5E9B
MTYVLPFTEIDLSDLEEVGGKNASLGELIRILDSAGVQVPGGFATTATAFREFLRVDGLGGRIAQALEGLDTADVNALAAAGARIRSMIRQAPLPVGLENAIRTAYEELAGAQPDGVEVSWAVRSSATAEDLPEASFAGQQETFLNVRGV